MKSKKFLLIIAIICSALMIAFLAGALVYHISPPEAGDLIKNITYNEGIVEKVSIDTDGGLHNKVHTITLRNCDTKLMVEDNSVNGVFNASSLPKGEKIVFGLSESSQEYFDEGGIVVSVIYLATDTRQIVSLESYEQNIIDNMNIFKNLYIIGVILFFVISLVCYTFYFISRAKQKRIR